MEERRWRSVHDFHCNLTMQNEHDRDFLYRYSSGIVISGEEGNEERT